MAALVEVDLNADVIEQIALKYRPEAVQRFIQTFDELPPGRVARSEATVVDTVTNIHRTHIGEREQRSGESLLRPVQVEITKRFEPFSVGSSITRFEGQSAIPSGPISTGRPD